MNSSSGIRYERPSPEAQRLVNGFRVYQMIAASCDLGLFDVLADVPRSAHELAVVTGAHESSLHRLLRGLVVWGLATEEPDGRFKAAPIGDAFRADRPGLRNMALMIKDDVYRAWGDLLHTVRTGESAYLHVFGESHFDLLGHEPELSSRFNAAMVETTSRISAAFIAAYDFAGARTVVDVGGGSGALLAAVLQAHPAVRGIVFDLAQGLEGAGPLLDAAGAGVAERVTLVTGSFFESVPPGGDLYMLKSIIHDWDDRQALTILESCRKAMAPSARLVLLERILPERVDQSQQAFDAVMGDLQMMVVLGGRERTTAEYGDLLGRAGLRLARFVPTASGFGIVEAIPAR